MKRLALRLVIALLTFVLGMTWAALALYRRDYPPVNKLEVNAQPQPAQTPDAEENVRPNPLDSAYIEGDSLSYAGYVVERSFDEATGESSVAIKKNGTTLAVHGNGGFGRDSTQIGLYSFLGGETKQLVIMQYTGGAHCCWVYKLYDFSPELRLIFDGEKYGIDNIGYELRPEDIDGDGVQEFTQAVMTFDYFHMSHASSVFPSAVFAYDEQKREYAPANHKFPDSLLEGIEEDLRRVEEERGKIEPNSSFVHERYLSAVLQVTLKQIYAGREADGWEFYDGEYNLNDRDEIKAAIQKALKTDPIYQSIRRRG